MVFLDDVRNLLDEKVGTERDKGQTNESEECSFQGRKLASIFLVGKIGINIFGLLKDMVERCTVCFQLEK